MKKHIIITGAGSGIGEAAAIELAKNKDVCLLLIGRTESKLHRTAAKLDRREDHFVIPMDITNKGELTKTLHDMRVDLNLWGIFANAGIGGENSYGTTDRWDDIINTNLNGTYFSVMESLPLLLKSKEKFKNIVITSSCLARFGVPNYTAYCTSKAGLLGLTKSLAVQYAADNILVNSICPGWVETDMAKQGIQLLADRLDKTYDETYAESMGSVPTGRMSKPDEVGKLVKFLMTNEEISITGQGIDINNGAYMG